MRKDRFQFFLEVVPHQLVLLPDHTFAGRRRSDYLRWGYRTPQEVAEKKALDLCTSREGINGPLFPSHVPQRPRDRANWRLV